MDKLTEIIKKLDLLYDEYKNKGSSLNNSKTKEVVLLLGKMTGNPESNTGIVANQLSRFSTEICKMYFEKLTKTTKVDILVIDELLKDLLITANKSKHPQHYVKKFADIIVPIVRNYNREVLTSNNLPLLVIFIASYAINSKSYKEVFQNLINKTDGTIYLFDYSNNDMKSLEEVWKITNSIFVDLAEAKYESFIIEWAKKYGFINEEIENKKDVSVDSKDKKEENITNDANIVEPVKNDIKQVYDEKNYNASIQNKEKHKTSQGKSNELINEKKAITSEQKTVSNTHNKIPIDKKPIEPEVLSKIDVNKLYNDIKRDMSKEREFVITALTDMITPIGKAFESIQGEISKSRKLGSENISLKTKVEELEKQLSEQTLKLQETNQILNTFKTDNEELKKKIESLEIQKSELDNKLNDAYAINSRESSLEAEKIRSELKKSFEFLYEDWLEFEFSDVSEENYESLQAIIKKTFRSLERNGIDFKGK